MKSHHYWKAVDAFKKDLREAVPHAELKALHVRHPHKHFLYAARQFAIIAVCGYLLFNAPELSQQYFKSTNPLFWIPLAILQGFTFFNMTILLHEVVHNAVFQRPRPRIERVLGILYAITSGISSSQFTRWHLDHHDNLGDDHDDPKRNWLSPKRNARWYKLLYCTPALMPIYFRAAFQETKTYEPALQRRIGLERLATMATQFSAMFLLAHFGGGLLTGEGWATAARVQLIPYFLVFPVAFTLNRLGQHYDIDPTHPLKWGTVMQPSRMWEFLFLYSSYHLEHHYFPRVPFYNLRKLHMHLRPLYARLGLRPHTYREILWNWFVLNKKPHTNWAANGAPASTAAAASVPTPVA